MVDSAAGHSTIELTFALRNLPQVDLVTKSDATVGVFFRQGPAATSEYKFVDRTETVWNNHNPTFTKRIELDYVFEVEQKLLLKVFDVDKESKSRDLKDHNFIGQCEVYLADIVSNPFGKSTFFVKDAAGAIVKGEGGKETQLIVSFEEIRESHEVVHMKIGVEKGSKSKLASGKHIVEILRFREDGTPVSVLRTDLYPLLEQKTLSIKSQTLCNCDRTRNLKFVVYSVGGLLTKKAKQVCFGETNLKKLTASDKIEMSDSFGSLQVSVSFSTITFLDYIKAGCQVSLMVAIDFTGSNGNPSYPASLHYLGKKDSLNYYEKAIRSVGDILAPYDSDQKFPVWGFGGYVEDWKETSHCFSLPKLLNMGSEVEGVDGILDAYHKSFAKVSLSGPTRFADIINAAAMSADTHFSAAKQSYFVLLIITDGIIDDMDDTIKAIIRASSLPLSIIIVGVGDADFSQMNALDSDDELLSLGSLKAKRDIVQFVPYREFEKSHYSALAKEVLKEVPDQILSYAASVKAKPMEPKVMSPMVDDRWVFDEVKKPGSAVSVEEKSEITTPTDYAASAPESPAETEATSSGAGGVRECIVCLDAGADRVVVPCMHLCLCGECAKKVEPTGKCPACRAQIESIRKVF